MSQKNSVSGDEAPDNHEGSLDVADDIEEGKFEFISYLILFFHIV